MKQTTSGSTTVLPTALNLSAQTSPQKKNRTSRAIALLGGLFMMSMSLFSNKADAQSPIATTGFFCTQTTTPIFTCVSGYNANNWVGNAGYWEYTASTSGYNTIKMTFNTQKSNANGPLTGNVYYDSTGTGSNYVLYTNYSVSTSCASKTINLPAPCNNKASIKVKMVMMGATANTATNRMPSDGGFEGTIIAACSTPTGGNITGTSPVCNGSGTTLNLVSASSGAGITYLWQYSTDSITWNNTGITTLSYNTGALSVRTHYRVLVTCSAGPSTVSSTGFTVNVTTVPTTISGVGASPMIVNSTDGLIGSPSGGLWSSTDQSVAIVDESTGLVTARKGGTTNIVYSVVDGTTGCTGTAVQPTYVVWPNTLALYAGFGGNSTGIITVPNETASALTATGFSGATACTSGGYSGLSLSTAVTSYSPAGPRVSYTIKPVPGKALNVVAIAAKVRTTGAGATKARLAYSLDGGANWTVDSAITLARTGSCGATPDSNSWFYGNASGLGDPIVLGIKDSIMVAIFPYGATGSGSNFQVNTLEVYGKITDSAACSGLGAAGAVTPSFSKICGSTGATRVNYDYANGSIGTFQWQQTTTPAIPGSWVPATPAAGTGITSTSFVTPTLTAPTTIYYRVKISCGGSDVFSAPDTVTVNTITTPSFTFGAPYLYIGTPVDLDSYTPTPGGGWFTSNDTSSTSIDSATSIATAHIPGISVVTYHYTNAGGCTGVARDTIAAIHPNTMAVYLGTTGSNTGVTISGDVDNASPVVKSAGFGTGTSCSTGGVSGMTTTATSYNAANPHVSFTIQPSGLGFDVTSINATVRKSNAGPSNYRIAYKINAGSWVPSSEFEVLADDCGYSSTEEAFAVSLPLSSSDVLEVAVYPYDNLGPVSGTFQVNTVSVIGTGGSPLKQGPATVVGNVNVANGIQLYPNPATNTLNVAAAEKVNVTILSIDGKKLIEQNDAKSVNVSGLASGLYLVQVYNANNELIKTTKFTKQ